MSQSSMTIAKTFVAAKAQNMAVKIPSDRELFLDIDSRSCMTHFLEMIPKLPGVVGWVKSPSKSGYPKCHVVVTLDRDITNLERILLQACLGSDRLHELLSYLAFKQGNPVPSVFFERR
jgi:hypothetical protein